MFSKVDYLLTKKPRLQALLAYSLSVVLCFLILLWIMKLWRADLGIQFLYGYGGGDDFLNCMILKGIMDNGWTWHDRFLGAPFGLDMHDYPCADNFSILLMKTLFFWTSNYSLVVNLYFLLTFPLTAIISLFVFRQFNISYSSAIAGSLLYAFLPYHFAHGVMHLQLVSYYFIPLIIMILLWICRGDSFIRERDENRRYFLINRKGWMAGIVCVCIGLGTGYYAFFSGFLLTISGLCIFFQRKDHRRLIAPTVLLGILCLSFLINLFPNLLYAYENGKNIHVVNWDSSASEIFGMKITHLLLPINGHRIFKLNVIKGEYNKIAPLLNENSWSSLGIIGSAGFLLLLIWLMRINSKDRVLSNLAIFNIAAVLLGTIGGFGSLFAFLFSPTIRAYNRISIFIAFFSLFAFVLILERVKSRLICFKFGRSLYSLLLSFIVIVGILDQTTSGFPFVPPYEKSKIEYNNDDDFVRRIESVMPKDVMIFQLPYSSFPDTPNMHQLTIFDPLRGYLHSKTLRWSYGTMKGREGDTWLRYVATKPLEKMIETLAFAGFSGIYIDRFAYTEEEGKELEEKLFQFLQVKPIVSNNQRLVFFDMASFIEKLKEKYTENDFKIKQSRVLDLPLPLNSLWKNGFSVLEGKPDLNWRWCSSSGEMQIVNLWHEQRKAILEMTLATGYERLSDLSIASSLFSEKLKINSQGRFFSKTVVVPPGKHIVRFESNSKNVEAPHDSRDLVFKVINFRIKDAL